MIKMSAILKNALKNKLIHALDFYFSQFIDPYNPIIMLTAACISYEYRQGNIALTIQYFENNYFFSQINKKFIKKILTCFPKKPHWKMEFMRSSAIGNGSSFTPLVFYKNKIYLYKIWKAEKNIANFLYQNNSYTIQNIKKYTKILNNLFQNNIKNMQKLAIYIALIRKISFILGGPGTGKTTIILKLIISLIKTNNKKISIKLVSPTGKSANRLQEVLQDNLFDTFLTPQEKKNVPITAITIHELLKIKKISQKSFFNEKNLLNIDILIIDEASMIDIFMIEHIFNVVSKKTKIIFIGDHNQLNPIETHSILKDISFFYNFGYSKNLINILTQTTIYSFCNTVNTQKNSFISDNVCILKKNYRFKKNSGIDMLAKAIINNNVYIINNALNNLLKNIYCFNIKNNTKNTSIFKDILKKYKNYWEIVNSKKNIKNIITALKDYQILCLLRNGLFGTKNLNQELENIMYKNNLIKYLDEKHQIWYIGKPIIITKNNKYLNLANGDIGVCNINKKGVLKVYFLDNYNNIKDIPVNILQDYETAWAITVHKSQGSEFNHTILVLPENDSYFFYKEILYTAVTRSKKSLFIYTRKEIFLKIASREKKHFGNLFNHIDLIDI